MSMSDTTKRVKEIRRKTRRKFLSEEKFRIVLDGLRGELGTVNENASKFFEIGNALSPTEVESSYVLR